MKSFRCLSSLSAFTVLRGPTRKRRREGIERLESGKSVGPLAWPLIGTFESMRKRDRLNVDGTLRLDQVLSSYNLAKNDLILRHGCQKMTLKIQGDQVQPIIRALLVTFQGYCTSNMRTWFCSQIYIPKLMKRSKLKMFSRLHFYRALQNFI